MLHHFKSLSTYSFPTDVSTTTFYNPRLTSVNSDSDLDLDFANKVIESQLALDSCFLKVCVKGLRF